MSCLLTLTVKTYFSELTCVTVVENVELFDRGCTFYYGRGYETCIIMHAEQTNMEHYACRINQTYLHKLLENLKRTVKKIKIHYFVLLVHNVSQINILSKSVYRRQMVVTVYTSSIMDKPFISKIFSKTSDVFIF